MSTQADDRLAHVEALIDAAETRLLTAAEAEEVRSAPRAVRGAQRVGLRREARMQRYLTAWHSARKRAHRLAGDVAMWRRLTTQAEQVRDRAIEDVLPLHAEIDHLRDQSETAAVRLWLIQQALQRIDASQDPAGIAGDIGPYLDGPLHPDHIAAYHAAQEH